MWELIWCELISCELILWELILWEDTFPASTLLYICRYLILQVECLLFRLPELSLNLYQIYSGEWGLVNVCGHPPIESVACTCFVDA